MANTKDGPVWIIISCSFVLKHCSFIIHTRILVGGKGEDFQTHIQKTDT